MFFGVFMNGIYILRSNDGFRVSYSNLYNQLVLSHNVESCRFNLNPVIVREVFGESAVYNSYESALNRALEISRDVPETDDGIMVLEYSNVSFEELSS